MTQANISHQPKLYIDNKLVEYDISGSINFPSKNQLSTLNVKMTNPDLQFKALLNKDIALYLNSDDSIPVFRGIVTSITPSDKETRITANDTRRLLSGNEGLKIEMSDNKNYDNYTLAQFIQKVISDKNIDIGVDFLKDTNPPINLKGVRDLTDIYSVVTNKIKNAIDFSDVSEPLRHYIDMYDDGNKSQIVIKKDLSIKSKPSYNFSFNDGIVSYTYKRRNEPNTVVYKGGSFTFSNTPTGKVSTNITDTGDIAKNRDMAIKQILLDRQQKDEITLKVSKCYDVSLGTIIHLDVYEEDILGNHRIVGKNISFGKSISCTLKLNKEQPKLSEYLQ